MNDEVKQQILNLQEQLKAGELTSEEYMIAMTRLTDPEKAAEMEADLLLKTLPDNSFEDDDDVIDDDDLAPRYPATTTQTKNMVAIIALVVVFIIFACSIFTIILAWVMVRASMG